MKTLLVAALLVRMSASGGAGAAVEAHEQRVEAGNSWEDVRKHFSALRSEVSTLDAEYRASLERHRLDAERRAEERDRARRGR